MIHQPQKAPTSPVRQATPWDAAVYCLLLPRNAAVEDVVVREPAVPANPVSKLWRYDYMCPLGTYITRFFGRQGPYYMNTLTAQCSRSWNLKTVGVPGLAEETSTYYTHTADGGYMGIQVYNGSGNADAVSFIPAAGPASPFYGNSNRNGGGTPSTLLCDQESRLVGVVSVH
jgi:hypothetical protein